MPADYGMTLALERTKMTKIPEPSHPGNALLGAKDERPVGMMPELGMPYGGQFDVINHPKHYNSNKSGIEAIEFIEHMPANVANAMKYLYRARMKDDIIQEYRKAIWYTFREIRRILVFFRHADPDELSEARLRKDMATVKEILDRWVDRA